MALLLSMNTLTGWKEMKQGSCVAETLMSDTGPRSQGQDAPKERR